MALSPDDIKNRYPLPVYNYRVNINGESIAFSEVAGLNTTMETTTYKESKTFQPGPGPSVMHMPVHGTPMNVTLKKGYVRGQNMAIFYNWINSIKLNQVEKKDITISLCDEEGSPVVTWKVHNAFPIKLDAPTFDANASDVAIESLELMSDGMSMEEN